MSINKIIAIAAIYLFGFVGWWILGTTTSIRSNDSFHKISPQVESLWGRNLVQKAPSFSVQIPGTERVRWIMPSKNEIQYTG